MATTTSRKRKWPFWLLAAVGLLLLLYAIAGFLFLPWWLEQKLPEQGQRHFGWQIDTASIAANPFALSVTLEELNAIDSDQEPVLNVQKLHLDLSFFQLFTGKIAIDELRVEQPYLRLRIGDGGDLNVAKDWRNNSPLAGPSAEADGDQDTAADNRADGGFPLSIAMARIEGGNILLQDQRDAKSRDFRISPLHFELQDVTLTDGSGDAGSYQLQATLGDDQTLAWGGAIEVQPFRSSGQIKLENISADTLWHFVGREADYDWRQGRIDLEADYRIDASGRLELAMAEGILNVRDSELFLHEDDKGEPALAVSRIHAEGISFVWPQSRLEVTDMSLAGWSLAVRRNAASEIDWLAAREEDENEGGDQNDAPEEDDFSWAVQHLSLTQGRVAWLDASTVPPAELTLEEIKADLESLTADRDRPVMVSLEVKDALGGRGRLSGDFTVSPFTLESSLQLSDIALPQFQPYLSEAVALTLRSGTAGFDGSVSLDDQEPELTGSLDGNLTVSDVKTRLQQPEAPFLAWKNLRLEALQVNLKPLAVDVRTAFFAGPELTYLRLPQGENSFGRLLPEHADEEASPGREASPNRESPVKGATQNDGATAPALRIQRLSLENATVVIEDRVIERGFRTRLHQIGGDIVGISNRKPQRGEINLQGQIDDQGSLRVTGEIGAIGQTDTTKLLLVANNADVEDLTPYFARFLGYTVETGTLEMEMDYTLEGDQLDGSNHIVLHNFKLGESVSSPAAIDAPVKVGIALLRGQEGTIDLTLPIDGALTDPEFNFTDVVLTAFTNLVGRAATAPFSVLARLTNLGGTSGEELGQVGFIAGRPDLAPAEPDKVAALADALKKRPDIVLNYHGATAPDWDGPALVLATKGYTLPVANLESQIRSLEQRYSSAEGEAALNQLIRQYEDDPNQRYGNSKWAQTLLQQLAAGRTPAPNALHQLAKERASRLREELTGRGVAPDKLSAVEVRADAAFNEGRVMIPLDIEPR